jgi:hypothetical protein
MHFNISSSHWYPDMKFPPEDDSVRTETCCIDGLMNKRVVWTGQLYYYLINHHTTGCSIAGTRQIETEL